MMPLSFAAMLGGMTTLIGSSTNLLVSSTLVDLGEEEAAGRWNVGNQMLTEAMVTPTS
jgi:di/tricarboxylate transporter